MKGKTVLIVGGILLLIGVLILVIGFALGGTQTTDRFEMKQFEATKPVSRLDITGNVGKLVVRFSEEAEFVSVEYPTAKNTRTDVSVQGDTFAFSGINAPWWDFFGWRKFSNVPDTVITLPRGRYSATLCVNAGKTEFPSGTYGDLKIKVNAGSFEGGELICESLGCEVNAGSCTVQSADCNTYEGRVSAGDLRVETLRCDSCDVRVSAGDFRAEKLLCPDIRTKISAGDVYLRVVGKKEEYDVTAKRSAGSIVGVEEQRVAGAEKFMNFSVSAGKIVVEFAAP